MDMLVVGMYGKGMNPETSVGGCTDTAFLRSESARPAVG